MAIAATAGRPDKKNRPIYESFGFQVLAAMVVGLILGYVARQIGPDAAGNANWLTQTLQQVGSIFVTLLRTLVPPLIFAAIVASIAMQQLQNAAKLVWQTLLWFAITALIAVVIGIALGLIIQPGVHTGVTDAAARAPSSTGSWLDFLKGLVPANIFGIQASTRVAGSGATTSISFNVLQLLVLSIVIGVAALKVGAKAEPFITFTRSLLAITHKILWWVIRLTPIGTIGLLGNAVAQYGWDALAQLGWYAAAIYIGLALVIGVVYPALLGANGLNILTFFKKVWPATQLAFVSRSSIGTLPVTERVTEQSQACRASMRPSPCRSAPPPRWTAAPPSTGHLGHLRRAVLRHPARHHALCADRLRQPASARPPRPAHRRHRHADADAVHPRLPLEGVGLLLAIDPILDMGRTAVNVTGQALVPTLVAKRQGILDLDRYNAGEDIDILDPDVAAVPAE